MKISLKKLRPIAREAQDPSHQSIAASSKLAEDDGSPRPSSNSTADNKYLLPLKSRLQAQDFKGPTQSRAGQNTILAYGKIDHQPDHLLRAVSSTFPRASESASTNLDFPTSKSHSGQVITKPTSDPYLLSAIQNDDNVSLASKSDGSESDAADPWYGQAEDLFSKDSTDASSGGETSSEVDGAFDDIDVTGDFRFCQPASISNKKMKTSKDPVAEARKALQGSEKLKAFAMSK